MYPTVDFPHLLQSNMEDTFQTFYQMVAIPLLRLDQFISCILELLQMSTWKKSNVQYQVKMYQKNHILL